MRRTVVVLALLALFLPAAAADKPWPIKGDVVFVSAELVNVIFQVVIIGGSVNKESPVPACLTMTVRKVKAKKPTIIVGPASGAGSMRLDGDWRDRIHSSRPECEKYLATHGQPRFTRFEWIHTIDSHRVPTSTAPSD